MTTQVTFEVHTALNRVVRQTKPLLHTNTTDLENIIQQEMMKITAIGITYSTDEPVVDSEGNPTGSTQEVMTHILPAFITHIRVVKPGVLLATEMPRGGVVQAG